MTLQLPPGSDEALGHRNARSLQVRPVIGEMHIIGFVECRTILEVACLRTASGSKELAMRMAKGMSGAFPLSAVSGRADVMDKVPPGGLGTTSSDTR